MAKINFPDSPADGDTFGEFIYNETTDVWDLDNAVIGIEFAYLVVAGGGGGGRGTDATGRRTGGGGGAGGLRSSVTGDSCGGGQSAVQALNLLPGTFSVSIGAGGAGDTSAVNGTSGNASQFGHVFAIGGGGGAHDITDGLAGGCGGGAGAQSSGNTASGGAGVAGQGYAGGGSSYGIPGGGGGAGEDGNTDASMEGGDGLVSTIITTTQATSFSVGEVSGSDVYFAGGGGASDQTGGLGGGATGTSGNSTPASNGTANTGGGGGGGGYANAYGGAGGSGVVILKYPATNSLTIGVGLTSSTITSGDYKITTFTAGSDTIEVA